MQTDAWVMLLFAEIKDKTLKAAITKAPEKLQIKTHNEKTANKTNEKKTAKAIKLSVSDKKQNYESCLTVNLKVRKNKFIANLQ